MKDPDPKYGWLRQAALVTWIPMVMAAGPIVGYFIGDFLDRFFETAPWLMVTFIMVGLVSSIQQTVVLIKRVSEEQNNDR